MTITQLCAGPLRIYLLWKVKGKCLKQDPPSTKDIGVASPIPGKMIIYKHYEGSNYMRTDNETKKI